MINKEIAKELIGYLHEGSHSGTQALVDCILKLYACFGIYTIAAQVVESCLVCKKINRQALRKQPAGEDL